MTEEEWLASTDPRPMLDFVRGRVSGRKLRLFACGCYRRVWNALSEKRDRQVIKLAELYADGVIGGWKLSRAELKARWGPIGSTPTFRTINWSDEAGQVAGLAVGAVLAIVPGEGERAGQAALLRCICGVPQRPRPTVEPGWLAFNGGTVSTLARAIYQSHRFADLPILADALEDAGCDDQDILDHLRSSGTHTRGCWALDLLLRKE